MCWRLQISCPVMNTKCFAQKKEQKKKEKKKTEFSKFQKFSTENLDIHSS